MHCNLQLYSVFLVSAPCSLPTPYTGMLSLKVVFFFPFFWSSCHHSHNISKASVAEGFYSIVQLLMFILAILLSLNFLSCMRSH